jgi:hypothetical protein
LPSPPPPRAVRVGRDELGLVVFWAGALASLLPPRVENDVYWHVAIGRWILEHRAVPTRDPFSFSAPGVEWSPPEWLGEIAMTVVYDAGGLQPLWVLRYAALLLCLALVYLRARERGAGSLAILIVGIVGAPPLAIHFGPRPLIAEHLLLALLLLELDRLRRGERHRLAWTPLLFLLWANLHPSWPLGLGVLALSSVWLSLPVLTTALSRARAHRLRRPIDAVDAATARLLARSTALSALAVLVQPGGLRGALYPFEHTFVLGGLASRFIGEWTPAQFDAPSTWIVIALAAALPLWLFVFRKRPPATGTARSPGASLDLILAAIALYLSLRHTRFLPLITIFVLPPLAAALPARPPPPGARWLHATLGVIGLFLAARYLPSRTVLAEVEAETYPVAEAAFVRAHPDEVGPRLFASFETGGFVLERVPGRQVFIDSRFDLYARTGIFEEYVGMHTRDGARRAFEHHRFTAVLWSDRDARALAGVRAELERGSEWRLATESARWRLYVRQTAP